MDDEFEDEDELYPEFVEEVFGHLGGVSIEKIVEMQKTWERFAEVLPESREDLVDAEGNPFDPFHEVNIPINEAMIFALRLSITKNEPPATFVSNFVAGFVLGILAERGEEGLEALEEVLKEAQRRVKRKKRSRLSSKTIKSASVVMEIMAHQDSPEELQSAEGLNKHLRKQARDLGKSFEDPDDDWRPICLMASDKQMVLVGLEIPAQELGKQIVFEMVLPQVRDSQLKGELKAVGFLSSAWGLIGADDEPPKPGVPIKDHPDSKEILTVLTCDSIGSEELWAAPILRSEGQRPGLDKWKKSPGGAGVHREGLIIDSLRSLFDVDDGDE